jgi:hypothetical protein
VVVSSVNRALAIDAVVGGEVELVVVKTVQELNCIVEDLIGAGGPPASEALNTFGWSM